MGTPTWSEPTWLGFPTLQLRFLKKRMVATGEVNFLDEPCPQRVEPLLHIVTVKTQRGCSDAPQKHLQWKAGKNKIQMSRNHTWCEYHCWIVFFEQIPTNSTLIASDYMGRSLRVLLCQPLILVLKWLPKRRKTSLNLRAFAKICASRYHLRFFMFRYSCIPRPSKGVNF